MFMDEARLAGLVRHPNVVGVSDVGEDEDGPYLIMDYVEGVSLSRAIREMVGSRRSVPMQVAVRICLEVAMGLHAAHEVRSEDGTVLHLVHRDVSPQNILIGFDGTVRVTDFGIAKALGNTSQTNAGVLKGNMGYLSPEQLRFEEPDRRSDFFSLGVTLYELLSGTRLYSNKDGFDGTRRILSEPPPDIGELRSDVPAELVELLFEMLSKDREARPSSALEIAGRLEGILAPLIAEEGSVTVADYMDQHFADHRQRHREFLTAHLRRIDAEILAMPRPTPSAVTTVIDTPISVGMTARRSQSRWLIVSGVAAAAAGVALFGLRGLRGEGAVADKPSPVTISLAAPDLPLGSDADARRSTSVPRPMSAPSLAAAPSEGGAGTKAAATAAVVVEKRRKRAARNRARLDSRIRDQARGPTFTKNQDDHGHLAVPLFTQWR